MIQMTIEAYLSQVPFLCNPKREDYAKIKNEMSVHIDGVIPEQLIRTRRPFEDEEIFAYRIANYEPITQGIIQEAIDSLFRIFNDNHYDLSLSKALHEYLEETTFEGINFMSWVQQYVVQYMLLDPNGVVLVYPTNVVDSMTVVNPVPVIVCSDRIIDNTTEVLTILSDQKSEVQNGANMEMSGNIYDVFTRTEYWQVIQVGDKHKNTYITNLVLQHNIGVVPYVKLGGIWNTKLGIYKSFFNGFVPLANDAIRQYSDKQGSLITCAYPQRVVKEILCSACLGKGAITVYLDDDTTTTNTCHTCRGKGMLTPASPYGRWTVVEEESSGFEGGKIASGNKIPPIQYIESPTESLRLLNELFKEQLQLARESLHLDLIAQAQSGTAKALDREREYASILKISNNIFDVIIYNVLYFMEYYINITSPVTPVVVKPTTFDLKTEEHILADIKMLNDANASPSLIRQAHRELIRKKYGGEMKVFHKEDFLLIYIDVSFNSYERNIELLASGIITLYDVQLACKAPAILDRMIHDGWSIDPGNYERVYAELIARFKKENPQIEPSTASATLYPAPASEQVDTEDIEEEDDEIITSTEIEED